MIIPTLLPIRSNRGLSRRSEIEGLFDNLFSGFDLEPWKEVRAGAFVPKIDVTEDDSKIVVRAELPGLDQEDIQISIKGDYLSIKGHKKEEREEKDGQNCRYMELSYGEFERVIPLQADINSDKVDASMKNGTLTLTLPKIIEEKQREKKISIRKS